MLLLGLAAVVGAALVAIVYREPAAGIALLLLSFVLGGYANPQLSRFAIQVGPISFYLVDLALIVVFVAYTFRRALSREPLPLPRATWLLLALLVIHTLRGFHTYGLQAALSGSRGWWWFLGGAVYAATVRWDDRVTRWLIVAGVAVIALGADNIATHGVQSSTAMTMVDGELVTLRPLNAAGALFLLQIVVALAFIDWPWPRLKRMFVIAGALVVVLAEQRTVWVAALLLAPFLYLRWLGRTHRRAPETGYMANAAGLFALPVCLYLVTRSASIAQSVSGATATNSTFGWRLASWRSLIGGLDPTSWLTGYPAGHPWTRIVHGQLTAVAPHSGYVDALLRFGLLGPVALVVLWLGGIYALRHASPGLPWPRWVGYAIVGSQLVFGITYALHVTDGIWLGLIFGCALRRNEAIARKTAALPEFPISLRAWGAA